MRKHGPLLARIAKALGLPGMHFCSIYRKVDDPVSEVQLDHLTLVLLRACAVNHELAW